MSAEYVAFALGVTNLAICYAARKSGDEWRIGNAVVAGFCFAIALLDAFRAAA